MIHFHNISAGSGSKKSRPIILSTILKRVGKSFIIIIPAMLVSSTAFAMDTNIPSCSECKDVVEKAENIRALSKANKVLAQTRRVSSYLANTAVCSTAINQAVDGTRKPMTPLQAVTFALLFLACGGFTAIHFLEE